jgi:hypothetical protein
MQAGKKTAGRECPQSPGLPAASGMNPSSPRRRRRLAVHLPLHVHVHIYTTLHMRVLPKEAPSNRRRQHHAFMHADAGAAYRTWNRSHTHRISNSSRRTGGANWHPRRSTDPSISTIYVCRGRGTAGQGGRSRDPFWAPLSRAIEERGFSDRGHFNFSSNFTM